ncbi:hypothetical protein HK100_001370, partial [Physocladia obscura]
MYCIAIAHLIHDPGDTDGAITAGRAVVPSVTVNEWLQGAIENVDLLHSIDVTKNTGHVKHA